MEGFLQNLINDGYEIIDHNCLQIWIRCFPKNIIVSKTYNNTWFIITCDGVSETWLMYEEVVKRLDQLNAIKHSDNYIKG